MKPLKGAPTKGASPTADRGPRESIRKRKAVLTMPITRTVEGSDHAARIAEHRRQLDLINESYLRSTQEVYSEPASLAKKKIMLRRNMAQLAKALGDWHSAALDLLADGQQAALLQMLPDFKGGRWTN